MNSRLQFLGQADIHFYARAEHSVGIYISILCFVFWHLSFVVNESSFCSLGEACWEESCWEESWSPVGRIPVGRSPVGSPAVG